MNDTNCHPTLFFKISVLDVKDAGEDASQEVREVDDSTGGRDAS